MVVRIARFMLPGVKLVSFGPCSMRKYSSVPVLLAIPPCFTSFTTPTMVHNGRCCGGPATRTLRPIAL
jgi:hypothetical protein